MLRVFEGDWCSRSDCHGVLFADDILPREGLVVHEVRGELVGIQREVLRLPQKVALDVHVSVATCTGRVHTTELSLRHGYLRCVASLHLGCFVL